jgi:hypothetical protein
LGGFPLVIALLSDIDGPFDHRVDDAFAVLELDLIGPVELGTLRQGGADGRDLCLVDGEVSMERGTGMVFQMTPGTDASAEMNTYFPQFKAMWMAENSTNTLHNLLTLRRAQVRDGLRWAGFLNETIELYGDGTEVKFQRPSLADVGQREDRGLLEEAARPLQPDELSGATRSIRLHVRYLA